MQYQDLKSQSTILLYYITVCVGINLILFFGTAIYALKQIQELVKSNLKELSPEDYAEKLNSLKITSFCGFLMALVPLALCIFLIRKRSNIQQLMCKTQNELLTGQTLK